MIKPQGKIVGPLTDIWMLGCIAYILDYEKHPFEDKDQSAILNAAIDYPEEKLLTELTKSMLKVEALERPTADEICQKLDA